MAKSKSLKASSPSSSVSSDDQWQTQDDANNIMRYAQLKQNKARHGKALQHIRAAADLAGDSEDESDNPAPTKPRPLARSGRRVMMRNIGKR